MGELRLSVDFESLYIKLDDVVVACVANPEFNDAVVFNNNVMTVGELVQELKKAAAVVEITYHKTIDENQESSNYSKRIELSSLLPVVRQVEGRKRV